MPSTQLVYIFNAQHVSTSQGHLQATGIKCIKGNTGYTNVIMCWFESSVLQIWSLNDRTCCQTEDITYIYYLCQ